jgi:PPK2 family polyphosphate:nucleotide phosphotransferase
LKRYLVEPAAQVSLANRDPDDTGEFKGNKQEALLATEELRKKLDDLQEVLYVEHKHKVLAIFQAMDTGGKDGAIRHVFKGLDPNGARVANFKEPTAEEKDHDFLWRVHRQVPAAGELVLFNRSHYEEVLIARVHKLVPEEVWSRRFAQINDFEHMLVENGTTILKLFLHIDRGEQRKRLQARLDEPDKRWKFRLSDLQDRKLWDQYTQAYEDVLNKTSTDSAPWYVVPANHKWYRDFVVSSILVDTLKRLQMKYPEPEENLDGVVIE